MDEDHSNCRMGPPVQREKLQYQRDYVLEGVSLWVRDGGFWIDALLPVIWSVGEIRWVYFWYCDGHFSYEEGRWMAPPKTTCWGMHSPWLIMWLDQGTSCDMMEYLIHARGIHSLVVVMWLKQGMNRPTCLCDDMENIQGVDTLPNWSCDMIKASQSSHMTWICVM